MANPAPRNASSKAILKRTTRHHEKTVRMYVVLDHHGSWAPGILRVAILSALPAQSSKEHLLV